jgi:hypothetical protein
MIQFDFIEKLRRPIIFILMLFSCVYAYSQDISGTYSWNFDDGRDNFEIYLSPKNAIRGTTPTSFKGEHCGVQLEGRRMDCSSEEVTISLNKISDNVFTGTILSAYSRTIHDIKVTYLPATKQIKWEVTNKRPGQIYFPLNVIMD